MKNNTIPKKERISAYEIAALRQLNSDQIRIYPAIKTTPAIRRGLVYDAKATCPNIFSLCRITARLARAAHNASESRIPDSLNWALKKIAQPQRKQRQERMSA